MDIKAEIDLSDVELFFENEEWEVQKEMIDAGDEAIRYAKANHRYENHTENLESSNDYDVDETGLALKNTAEYASYVEAKGFEVISHAALMAEKRLKEKLE